MHTLKRVTKLIISIGFFLVTSIGDTILRSMGRTPPARCVVLHYHSVGLESRPQFARQMDSLIRWATPIAANHRHSLLPGKNYAAVTFDDAFQCVIQNAVPELIQRRIPATLFVVTDLLGATANWTTFNEDRISEERIATAEQLMGLPPDLITVGSHTMSHPWLPSLSQTEAKTELSASREKLRNLLNRDINVFSFPYGALTEQLVTLCREVGYERVFTIRPRLAFASPQEFVVGRIAANPTDWTLEFHLKLLGAYRWLGVSSSSLPRRPQDSDLG
jgi:peptidoglycan/xylan/chitin deacetylase (PgdA/CDA1 family)